MQRSGDAQGFGRDAPGNRTAHTRDGSWSCTRALSAMSPQLLKRKSDEVVRLVAEARSRSTRRWVPGKDADPSAIENVRAEFDSSLVPPEIGTVEVEPHVAGVLNIEAGSLRVWFVTKPATQRVFVDDESGLFGIAWGPDASTGKYVDLGFRTGDPIDAFLT